MKNFDRTISARLQDKLAAHERTTRCGRVDLRLVDYEMVDPHVAQLAVAYSRERGAPAPSQLGEWVLATSNGLLRLHTATVFDYPEKAVLKMHVYENQLPMPITRKASMIRTGGNTYMDAEKNQWRVVKGPGEEDILVRANGTDINALLEERVDRQRSGRYASVTLADLRVAGTAQLEVGDTVIYTEPGNTLQKTGTISSISGDKVTIKGAQGAIDRSYILDVAERSPSAKKKRSDDMVKFMTEYEFAGDKSMGKLMREK